MPILTIEDPEAQAWATELSETTGKSVTRVVKDALLRQLQQERSRQTERNQRLVERVMKIAEHASSLPILDDRTPEEIIGYDENGIPR